ncbi:MAG: pyridoxamine 5'-phosphate oxidase family protein [Acetivibrionales bacterium]
MTKNEVFEAITKNPVFYLATVEDDQPRVRAMLLYRADESGIIFHTATAKDVYKQICKNNKAELCFSCNGTQIRISGALELIDDKSFKDEIVEHPTRAFLKAWKEQGAFKNFYEDIAVFRLEYGTACIWTMDKNFAPKEKVQL